MDVRERKERRRRKNIEESSNFLSALFFGWTRQIFWKGAKHDLQTTDLYDPLKSDESEQLGNHLEREWIKELAKSEAKRTLNKNGEKKRARQPSLGRALTRVFWLPYMILGLFIFFRFAFLHVAGPILQGWIIEYFDEVACGISRTKGLIYAGLLVLVIFLDILIMHHTDLRTQQIGMRVRVACCSLIYRKVLRLDQNAAHNTAAGKVANLISNDVARFDSIFIFLHHFWIMPIQLAISGYVMWLSIGVATFIAIGATMAQTLLLQGYFSHVGGKLRAKIARKTDERVQLMTELISGIQVVKMYSWEKPFNKIVSKVRDLELKVISYASYLKGFNFSMILLSGKITLYFALTSFVLIGNTITAETAFVSVGLINALRISCAVYFPLALILAGEAAVSLDRLTEFLLLDEVKCVEKAQLACTENGPGDVDRLEILENGVGIRMDTVAANWIFGNLPPTLSEVSLEVKNRCSCALVGPVGSGKSSLLHLILGELAVGAGKLSFFTGKESEAEITSRDIRVSYASQESWLFSASIRDNILFGLPYEKKRYQEVTEACALLKDFDQLSQGDLSLVGERGASLSGGQRARVNLARAVYRDADLYLLDDPLSAVDSRVGRHLFEKCINGFLKSKTRIIVTHQLQYLEQVDTVIFVNRGTVECQGTLQELSASNFRNMIFENCEKSDDAESTEKVDADATEFETKDVVPGNDEQQLKHTESMQELENIDDEEMATGSISSEVYRGYFFAGGNLCTLAIVVLAFVAGQVAASGCDYWMTYWTNQETLKSTLQSNKSVVGEMDYNNSVSQWVDERGLLRQNVGIWVYTACIAGCTIIVVLSNILFVRISMNASRNIHNAMFSNILEATMRFFNTNPSGRILNRFSKDVGAMDEMLPSALMEMFQNFNVATGSLVMVFIVNNWMIIPTVVAGGVFYFITILYIKTAQSLKRLEGITKSPVFSHVGSTLDGLVTIRSSGSSVEELLRKEFDRHQDTHTTAWYMTIATATAFGFVLDLMSWLFIACVCFSLILIDDENTSGGFAGLAISQSMILIGIVQEGLRYITIVISQMTSVERLLQYTNLPKEGPFAFDNSPPSDWPSMGSLDFKDVSMTYSIDKPPALKGLNLNIRPGWKVGVVGRTGAGKSSLISALFRLVGDGLDGEIFLDGISTKSIGLNDLRSRISIIPQEPILFSASLRYNLDPFEQYSDAELWNSIREVELGGVISSLDFSVAGGGANFSVGQRQLICLARAILRNNRLLVLDEATANVDPNTDALIQRTIRRRFVDSTVLTVAHRLNTIMDSDRVLVMDGGRIVEFDHPHLLLKDRDGYFSQMVQQTGKTMAEELAKISESAFPATSEIASDVTNDALPSDEKI
ncbi:ATP-binding cassette sub-family C member 4-like isoform X2 [Neodiprion pinetum]|uniref:ATP-binding cassette sub-family C member 4-like isoform X2 n=1 Tax=Neodiprion pinetum TaxID=441929 RepID=UPI001EE01FA4|nr:ATP-binding cassette sub-family C member 4-like isoform X2 [Neodiprion pinetum]